MEKQKNYLKEFVIYYLQNIGLLKVPRNKMKNYVYIATSLDGYIADLEETLDWLPIPESELNFDLGFDEFLDKVDAIVMGTNTFKVVCAFEGEWFYTKPVFVVSNSILKLPKKYEGKVYLINGSTQEILKNIHSQGYKNLYIDGGINIQNFLKEDLIDEMIITTIPVLLGGGIPLFGELPNRLNFECISSSVEKGMVQNRYKRIN